MMNYSKAGALAPALFMPSPVAENRIDSQRSQPQNERCPASSTDRRDICLLLTQDVGFFLKAKKRAGSTPRIAGEEGYKYLEEGEKVTYEAAQGRKGMQAENVTKA